APLDARGRVPPPDRAHSGRRAMTAIALPLRVYEYWLMQYRRIWRGTVITSIINPVFYLGALGVGLGSLVNKSGGQPLGVPYLDFVAPGMLASASMQLASSEASWPVMGSFKWTRQYFAMIATPLGVRDVVAGPFFPVSRLPLPLEWLAYATPLWHGVDLCRELTLGNVHLLRALGHVAFLLALAAGGLIWAQRTYARRLFT